MHVYDEVVRRDRHGPEVGVPAGDVVARPLQEERVLGGHIYIYIYICVYLYIYVYTYIYIYIYIYMYRGVCVLCIEG